MRIKLIHWAAMLALVETIMYFLFRPTLLSPETSYRDYVALLKILLVFSPIFVTLFMVVVDLIEQQNLKRWEIAKANRSMIETHAYKVVKREDGRVFVYLKDVVRVYMGDYNWVTVSYANAKLIVDTARELGVKI